MKKPTQKYPKAVRVTERHFRQVSFMALKCGMPKAELVGYALDEYFSRPMRQIRVGKKTRSPE